MNPIKCPIADEGEDGTVQGLMHTKIKPNIKIILPKFFVKLSFEERLIHAPSAIMDIGSQKNTTASSISSIPWPSQSN